MAIWQILWLALWRQAPGVPTPETRATRARPAAACAVAPQGHPTGRHPLV